MQADVQFYDSPAAYFDDHEPVRSSSLKSFEADKPGEYEKQFISRTVPGKKGDALRIGSVVDDMVTLPDGPPNVMIYTETKGTDTVAYRRAEAENPDKILLTPDQHARCMAMAAALQRTKRARGLLKGKGKSQVGIKWRLNDVMWGKALLDRCCFEEPFWIADLKTTRFDNLDDFEKAIKDYGYHRQLAWYCDAYAAVTGRRPETVWLLTVSVSKHWPHIKTAYADVNPVDWESLEIGREDNEEALKALEKHYRSQDWSPPEKKLRSIGLPEWYLKRRRR